MKIAKIDLFEVLIPFRFTFKHASNSRSACHAILVRVTTDSGQHGWGEAHPRPYLTGETIASCLNYARNQFGSILSGVSFSKIMPPWTALSESFLESDKGRALAIWSGVDLAIADAWSRSFSVPIQAALVESMTATDSESKELSESATATTKVTAPIGLAPLPLQLGLIAAFKMAGFSDFKLKVHTANHVKNLGAMRRLLGDQCSLRVDVNGAWSLEEAKGYLADLEKNNVSAIEQPLAAAQLSDTAKLQRLTSIPIMADESYCSLQDASDLGNAKACKMVNFRLGKNGGLSGWVHHKKLIDQYGFKIQLGTLVGELGPIPAASAILRSQTKCNYFEFGFPAVLVPGSPFEPVSQMEKGKLSDLWNLKKFQPHVVRETNPACLGLAEAPDMEKLKKFLVSTETLNLSSTRRFTK